MHRTALHGIAAKKVSVASTSSINICHQKRKTPRTVSGASTASVQAQVTCQPPSLELSTVSENDSPWPV